MKKKLIKWTRLALLGILAPFTRSDIGYIKLLTRLGFKGKDGAPTRCTMCGHDDFESRVTDRIDYTVCEMEYHCKKCNSVQGYWAYGHFQLM